jgi:hypothetical protein
MPQGASGAVREPILRRLALRDRKTGVVLRLAADTEPFSHSLGPKQTVLDDATSVAYVTRAAASSEVLIGRTNWNRAPFTPSEDAVSWPP